MGLDSGDLSAFGFVLCAYTQNCSVSRSEIVMMKMEVAVLFQKRERICYKKMHALVELNSFEK